MHYRVIIGAPRGSYPGGFNLSDPGLPATVNTGLVYSCPLGPGDCEPIRGDTTRYVGGGINITNGYQVVMNSDLTAIYSQGISEGRLFDQARKFDDLLRAVFILLQGGSGLLQRGSRVFILHQGGPGVL